MAANTVIPVPPWIFPIRIAQFVISFLVLIFTISAIALWNGYYSFGLGIFTDIATIIITGYWYYANKRNPAAYNRWAILFLDGWAILWWIITFSTLAQLAAAFNTLAEDDAAAAAALAADGVTGVQIPLSGKVKASRALTGLSA